MATEQLFTEDHLTKLREEYGKMERVDPCSESYKRFVKLLDSLPQSMVKQLAGANIKWISMLARNRIK